MKRITLRKEKTAIITNHSRQIGFILSLMSVAMLLFLTPPITSRSKVTISRLSPTANAVKPVCAACAAATTQTVYAPLIQLDESSGTEINLNCRSPHSLEVTPTFYTKKGEAFTGDSFEMGPAEVKTVDLKTLMPRSVRNRHDLGGMTLSHGGLLMEMWGQLRLMKVGGGDSVDVTFVNIADKRSEVREAVWSMPEHGAASIAIGNLGTHEVTAKLQFSNGDYQEVKVPSFGTGLVRTHEGRRGSTDAGAVTITAADGSGDLIAAGAVTGNGFTSSIRFYDTKNVAQQNLYATNFRLHRVHSKIVLRNSGTESIVATPRLRPAQGDPNNFIDLSGISLGPQEIKTIDLDSISGGTRWRSDFDTVSIEVINSGPKGSLIAALNGIDDRTGMSYDVPLRDSGGPRNLSGAYPWRLDGDVSTVVSITNAALTEAQFVVQINYPGGPYLLDPQKLTAGDTKTFNLRKIRDQQIPDRNGHTIPKSVQGGQFRWFIHSGGHLIGRAEMLSVARGISGSYSCGTPCPPHYDHGEMAPDTAEVPVEGSTGQAVLEYDVDSYSNQYGPYSASVVAGYSSDNYIATYDGASVGGVSMGDVSTSATVEYPLYVNWEGDCDLYGTNYDSVYGQAQSKGEVHVSSVTPTVTLSARDNGSGTCTVQVGAGPGIPANVSVTVQILLDSTTNQNIQVAAPSPASQGIAVHSNSPGSGNFTVGTIGGNSVSGTLIYKAYITAVNSEAVTFSTVSQGTCTVTVP
jgi:RimJ/RimL family protein N-acetyltransferase